MGTPDSIRAHHQWPKWILMLGVSFVSFFAFVLVVWLLSSQLRLHLSELGGANVFAMGHRTGISISQRVLGIDLWLHHRIHDIQWSSE